MTWGYIRMSSIEVQASKRLYVIREYVSLVMDQGSRQTEEKKKIGKSLNQESTFCSDFK